jgi:hypothetical protein
MHRMRALALAALLALPAAAAAQPEALPPFLGRWDITATDTAGVTYPSWLEVSTSGFRTFVGRFQGRVGSARAISRLDWSNGALTFAIPPQWQRESGDLRFEARVEGERLVGTFTNPDGTREAFTAVRAPTLARERAPVWGAPVALFNGRDLAGWAPQGAGENHWRAVNGVLTNTASGTNLMTTRKFDDFRLRMEFRYPANGNSGVYLRGRHEVQIEDTRPTQYPLPDGIGGVYGFLYPNESAARGPGQWNTYDITLVGRRVTIVLNGKTVVCDQVIPGPTGGALDANEGEPGPILLQGDHTAVEFRNVRIQTPLAGERR